VNAQRIIGAALPEELRRRARCVALPSPGEEEPAAAVSCDPAWCFEALAGHLVEISGGSASAALTLACRLVFDAQTQGEPVVWLAPHGTVFFPPDAATAGIDLDALIVVRPSDPRGTLRAADQLVRSGGFGLVVLDLVDVRRGRLENHARFGAGVSGALNRLAGLARQHGAAVLFVTAKSADAPSLGPLVAVRVEAVRGERLGEHFGCEARVLRDKRRGAPAATYGARAKNGAFGYREALWHREVCRGPDGLC